jgi:dTDP-4-dehydrorhamnose reductase
MKLLIFGKYGQLSEELQRAVTGAFEERFPLKSKFENE